MGAKMLRDVAVDLIVFRLGNRPNLRAMAIAEMEHIIQTELSLSGHYFLWQLGAWGKLGELQAGDSSLTLSGYLSIDEDTPITFATEPPEANVPQVLTYHENFWPDTIPVTCPSGAPTYWRWIGSDVLEFDKRADVTYGIYGRGYVTDASVAGEYGTTGNIENRWLKRAPDVVVAAVGRRLALTLGAKNLFDMFDADFQKAWTRVYTEDIARREALADRASTEN